MGGPIKIFDRGKADRLHDQGKSVRSIAIELGIPFSTLYGDFKRRGKLSRNYALDIPLKTGLP